MVALRRPSSFDTLTVPVDGQDPADALYDALYELLSDADVRVTNQGLGAYEFWGRPCRDDHYTVVLTGDDIPDQIVLVGLRDDDAAPEPRPVCAERECDGATGEVQVVARLLERVGNVATYAIEVDA